MNHSAFGREFCTQYIIYSGFFFFTKYSVLLHILIEFEACKSIGKMSSQIKFYKNICILARFKKVKPELLYNVVPKKSN